MADIREFFATWSGKPPEEFSGNLYSYFDEAAIGHLFRVSAGLDSVSVGEGEVLGQVRQAWELARNEGSCGPALSAAFRHALQVGKRARSETESPGAPPHCPTPPSKWRPRPLGSLEGKQAVVVGLGEVGEMAARAFSGVPGMLPGSRRRPQPGPSGQCGRRRGGTRRSVGRPGRCPGGADVVACSTSGHGRLLEAATVREALAGRPQRPLLLVDMAVPRDIDPAVVELPGVACSTWTTSAVSSPPGQLNGGPRSLPSS